MPSTWTQSRLGVGIGWRPEIDLTVERLPGIDWVEVVAEGICPDHLPESLQHLRGRGLPVVPHGVSLSLGSAEPPDPERLSRLARCAEAVAAPLVTEHAAFVRAGGRDAGHLLPIPRTREALGVLAQNVRLAQATLPVPLAVENVAPLLGWPDDEMTEGQFLAELVERTGVGLLLDVANLYTSHVNLGLDPVEAFESLPLEAVAYVHVGGGVLRDGVWHDTHAHPVPAAVLDLLAAVCERVTVPGVLLERDDDFPPESELAGELDAIRDVLSRSSPPLAPATPLAGPPADARNVSQVAPGIGARAALGQGEAGLIAALVGGSSVPPRFDPVRVRIQSGALLGKRRQSVARLRPDLAESEDFRERFDAYAAIHPCPAGGTRSDADAFARTQRHRRGRYFSRRSGRG